MKDEKQNGNNQDDEYDELKKDWDTEIENDILDDEEDDGSNNDNFNLIDKQEDEEFNTEDKARFNLGRIDEKKNRDELQKKLLEKESKLSKRKRFFKKLASNFSFKENTFIYNLVRNIVYVLDFLLNAFTTAAAVAAILFSLYYVSVGNWIMSLTCIAVAIGIEYINRKIE